MKEARVTGPLQAKASHPYRSVAVVRLSFPLQPELDVSVLRIRRLGPLLVGWYVTTRNVTSGASGVPTVTTQVYVKDWKGLGKVDASSKRP